MRPKSSGRKAAFQVQWCGLDFGETLMNPFTLHQSAIIAQVYNELGRAGEGRERVRRWYRLRDSFGRPNDPPELRVREVKQYGRRELYREVLDNDARAIELFEEKETRGFSPAPRVQGALSALSKAGIEASIVSETATLEGVRSIVGFLRFHRLKGYIAEIITPAGRFSSSGALRGSEFAGMTKKSGEMYRCLASYLTGRGIPTSASAMIGDDPTLDIKKSGERGMRTIQYIGIVDRGKSYRADVVMRDWKELPTLLGL